MQDRRAAQHSSRSVQNSIADLEFERVADLKPVLDKRYGAVSSTNSDLQLVTAQLYRVADAALRRALGGQSHDYSDLLQTVLERVVRSLNEGRFSGKCSLTTWVSVIANHVATDELRARMRGLGSLRVDFDESAEEQGMGAAGPVDLEHQLEARSDLEQVWLTLQDMDEAQAATIFLHDVLGHELSEIAEAMSVSVAAAQSRLVRGRKQMRRRLSWH